MTAWGYIDEWGRLDAYTFKHKYEAEQFWGIDLNRKAGKVVRVVLKRKERHDKDIEAGTVA